MNTEKRLYQWDTGQKLVGCTGLYVDFPIGTEVYRVETTDGMCIIPDELLQTSGGHKVYECMTNNTIRSFAFSVTPRPKPPDYVYTPTERLTFEGLVQKVDDAVADMIRRAESGEFDGYTPVKGKDYFTTEEIQQIQNEVSSGAIGEFKSVVDTETETFNNNAETKLIAYNQNDSEKTASYNANATKKLNAYNTNANNRLAEFDAHTEQIQTDVGELKSDLADLVEKIQGKNRFDKSKCQLNKYLNPSGTLSDYDGRIVTDYIPVEVGKVATISYVFQSTQEQTGFSAICLYDGNKQVVSGGDINLQTFTIPYGVAFVRLTLIKTEMYDCPAMVELTTDGVPTEYEPYSEAYKRLTDYIIEKSNLAKKEYVDNKTFSFASMTNNIACSLPIGTRLMTVGIPESWYEESYITPNGFSVELFDLSTAIRGNKKYSFRNTSAYNSDIYFKYDIYDILLNKIKTVDNNDGYGFPRYCKALNLQNCSLLAIGDSTVDHDVMTAKIKSFFTENGKEITLLGTLGDGQGNGNNNEGRAGWKTSDYFTNKQYNGVVNPFYNSESGTFDFSYYMNQQGYSSVDFVVIQLGINDLYNTDESYIETTWNNIKAMIDSIHTFNENIKVILNLPTTPNADESKHTVFEPRYRNRVIRYCEYAISKVKELYATSKVRVSYCHLILDPNTDIIDDVHPTTDGYEKMALEVINQINNWQN